MRLIIADVAALGAKGEGNTAVGGDREDEEKLLEVRPMILAVAVRDRDGLAAEDPLRVGGLGVVAVKGDGRGVVMEFVERKPELPHDMGHDREHEARDVGCEQCVECPPDPVARKDKFRIALSDHLRHGHET